MNNNDIFKKLRVALQLRDDQIVEILELVDFRISKGEIGNMFRNPEHEKFMECGDQVLRNFLNGLVIHLRGPKDNPKNPEIVLNDIRAEIRKPAKGVAPKEDTAKKPVVKSPAKGPAQKKKPVRIQVVENVKFKNGKKK
jgi:hypothetical protein